MMLLSQQSQLVRRPITLSIVSPLGGHVYIDGQGKASSSICAHTQIHTRREQQASRFPADAHGGSQRPSVQHAGRSPWQPGSEPTVTNSGGLFYTLVTRILSTPEPPSLRTHTLGSSPSPPPSLFSLTSHTDAGMETHSQSAAPGFWCRASK